MMAASEDSGSTEETITGGLAAGLLAVVALAGCGTDTPSARPRTEPSTTADADTTQATGGETAATVVSVTDGDTIVVRLGDSTTEHVRLIGIDTPETKDPRTVVECFGAEAAAETGAAAPTGHIRQPGEGRRGA